MGRYIYQGVAQDGTGRVIASASILVYEAGTTTGATIYALVAGGSADADSTITSGTDGSFQFFIDSGDYSTAQAFDILISKTNYNTTTLEDVSIF